MIVWFPLSDRTILLVSEQVKFIRICFTKQDITPSEGVKVRHSHVDSENVTNNRP